MRIKLLITASFLLLTLIILAVVPVSALSLSPPNSKDNILPLEVFSQDGLIKTITAPAPSFSVLPKTGIAPLPHFEVVKIIDNGPDNENIVIAVMGDGFTESEQDNFIRAAQMVSNYLLDFYPFSSFKDIFNVYAIKVISNQSGAADNPHSLIDNYFGSTFYYDSWTPRLLFVTKPLRVFETLNTHKPEYDMAFIMVNSIVYGGGAGKMFYGLGENDYINLAVTSIEASAPEILVHEMGHAVGGLADEYWWDVQESPNKTQNNNPATNKWRHWLGLENIGMYPFEEDYSWFRPHQKCEMRFLNNQFCMVCATELTKKMSLIAQKPFFGRTEISNAIIPEGTTSIGDFSYYGCEKLTNITIPSSVTAIGNYVFMRCEQLTSITDMATIPQIINNTTFAGVDREKIELLVPIGTKTAYESAGWGGFNIISEHYSGVAVKGRIKSYNPQNPTFIQLLKDGEAPITLTTKTSAGYGQFEQDFTFTGINPGVYKLIISKAAHTKFTIQKIVVGDTDIDLAEDNNPEIKLINLRCGDINGDGMINNDDLMTLWNMANYNKNAATAANKYCDLNGDGLINNLDLAILWLPDNYNRGEIIIE
ncbi:MAG: M64 family metallo-endopeptidase [Firmicutes bacterium]|nr:M64 family metallo-endopeptidase [Bacillota bacterium]